MACEDEDGRPIDGEERLRAWQAAQAILKGRRALLVFDEAEDVFQSGGRLFKLLSAAKKHKGWLNRRLEESPPLAVECHRRPGSRLHPAF